MTDQTKQVILLNKKGYSVRQIETETGVSKSQVQRILKRNAQRDSIKNPQGTVPNVSQPTKNIEGDSTEYNAGTDLIQIELEQRELKIKQAFDEIMLDMISCQDFSIDEVEYYLDGIRTVKNALERLIFDKKIRSNKKIESWDILLKLLNHLSIIKGKMNSETLSILKSNIDYDFRKGTREVEYEDEEDEVFHNNDIVYQYVIVVDLWGSIELLGLKAQIERLLIQRSLSIT